MVSKVCHMDAFHTITPSKSTLTLSTHVHSSGLFVSVFQTAVFLSRKYFACLVVFTLYMMKGTNYEAHCGVFISCYLFLLILDTVLGLHGYYV